MLQEICVSGTVGGAPTNVKIPHLHIHKPKNRGSGNRVSDFRVSGRSPVYFSEFVVRKNWGKLLQELVEGVLV